MQKFPGSDFFAKLTQNHERIKAFFSLGNWSGTDVVFLTLSCWQTLFVYFFTCHLIPHGNIGHLSLFYIGIIQKLDHLPPYPLPRPPKTQISFNRELFEGKLPRRAKNELFDLLSRGLRRRYSQKYALPYTPYSDFWTIYGFLEAILTN